MIKENKFKNKIQKNGWKNLKNSECNLKYFTQHNIFISLF